MNTSEIASIAAAIVTVALVTVLVTKENTAKVITAVGNSFAGSLRAAMGNG